jgi:hypothetical protein
MNLRSCFLERSGRPSRRLSSLVNKSPLLRYLRLFAFPCGRALDFMKDLLPTYVMGHLHDRFVAGVADAEAVFSMHEADEDAVSGALGQSIAMQSPVVFKGPQGDFAVEIKYKKIRGRGPNAPEKRYGADGLFQISILNERGSVLRQKALPYQAKMNWRGKNKGVYVQAMKMQEHFVSSVVVNFTKRGYRGCTASLAVETEGSLPQVEARSGMSNLGQILGVDFLECRVGTIGLFFDPVQEIFDQKDILPPVHLITTEVRRITEHEF